MNAKYKRAFDAVHMSSERREQIRLALTSQHLANQEENKYMSTITTRRNYRVPIVVAAAILALALVGFTFGNQIIELLGGGRIEYGTDHNGDDYVTMDIGFASDPVEVREGQIYFVLDGSGEDITERCSEESYFEYEHLAANGYRHVVIIGGTPDTVGWGEFVWDESGNIVGGNATYPTEEEPVWLENARTKFH